MKSIVIALAMICSLWLGVVSNSDAIEITSVWPGSYDSYSGFYPTHYVSTDNPIYYVSWTVNGETACGKVVDDGSTSTYCDFDTSNYPGHIKGQKYEIEVEVWEWDEDDEVFRSDNETYTIHVYFNKMLLPETAS